MWEDSWPCEDRGRDWRYAATSQGRHGPPEAGRGKEGFSPRTLRESTALPTSLDLGLQNYERINFCCVSHPVCGSCYGSPRKLIPMEWSSV